MMTKYARTKLSRLIAKLPEKAAQSLYELAQKMFPCFHDITSTSVLVIIAIYTVCYSASGFYHLNNANAFHSFIKSRYQLYRGVATKYLNRYNTLFAVAYKRAADYFCQIAESLLNVSRVNRFVSYHDLAREGLLCL